MKNLRYPIGKFDFNRPTEPRFVKNWMADIEALPEQIKTLIQEWTPEHFQTTYRPKGWTGAQVINHLADSHINAYTRFKLTLTQDNVRVMPYNEAAWAELADGQNENVAASLNLLTGLHQRWTTFLQDMSTADFQKTFYHPGMDRQVSLAQNTGLYSWHGRHHLAHLKLIGGKE